MNHEEISRKRQFALKWWRELLFSEKQQLAKKHFPNWSFILVCASSYKIQKIWENETAN